MRAITSAILADKEFHEALATLLSQKKVAKPLPLLINGLSDGAKEAFLAEMLRACLEECPAPLLLLASEEGEAVADAATFYKIPPEQVLVICDDVSFDPGVLRIRKKGSAGGHNGLKSIIACLGSDAFPRIKMGVGKKPEGYDMADFVLGRFGKEDGEKMNAAAQAAADAAILFVNGKADEAMNRFSR